MLRLAYNTNGFPQHRVEDVAAVLARLGYAGIAITPDTFQLDPMGDGPARARALAPRLTDLGLAVAVETGARFVLDPVRKHQPTLLDGPDGAARRLEMLRRCLAIAVTLGAETFSFWSGTPTGELSRDEMLDRLCAGANALLNEARGSGVRVCFEPEPGMAVASLSETEAFFARLARDELLLMLDVGHVPVTETITPARAVTDWASRLGGLQLDDSRGGVHEHLAPGEGEIDWPALLAAIDAAGFDGLAALELPRHGHDPVATAVRAKAFLDALPG
ncbi:MAG: sugar phosphate isomerase/epimerase family protein [Planctomycetota bacterium]|jgi:sugar phosphate isomerase/epimerase